MRRRWLNWPAAGVLSLMVAGCVAASGAPTPEPTQHIGLSIHNGTTMAVTIVVNGSVIETVPPGTSEDPIQGEMPAMPWAVEVRSPTGRVMTTLDVHPGDYATASLPDGGWHEQGVGRRLDLSCGRLDLWYGTPILGPAPYPSASYPSGDCS
jgi:hypothetical protein